MCFQKTKHTVHIVQIKIVLTFHQPLIIKPFPTSLSNPQHFRTFQSLPFSLQRLKVFPLLTEQIQEQRTFHAEFPETHVSGPPVCSF